MIKGPWTVEEDLKLTENVKKYGARNGQKQKITKSQMLIKYLEINGVKSQNSCQEGLITTLKIDLILLCLGKLKLMIKMILSLDSITSNIK